MAENHALIPEPIAMYTQTESLKESREMAKNLMSGDFERQYRDGLLEKCTKRKQVCLVFAVAVGVLAAWLLALTVVREVQIAGLRRDVEKLTNEVFALYNNLEVLNHKIVDAKIQNEFKTLEDTIYADEDNIEDTKDGGKEDESSETLNKLSGLTVLEDGEDIYDGDDDAESGDWYPDYDRRRDKIGTTNMVKLKPEDFTDSVLSFDKQNLVNNIREIKRMLNENPELSEEDLALSSSSSKPDSSRDKRSVLPDAPPEAIEEYAVPKIVSKGEDRPKVRKFSPNPQTTTKPTHTVSRTPRNSEYEGGRRPFIAAHFHGNTSHLSTEIHEHYKGNGLVRVSHGAAHDVWFPAAWTSASPHPRPTLTRNGHVHVHHTGVYLVYAQIYYLDSHDIISWVLHRTNANTEGRETLLQCAQSSHSSEPVDKPNSCFSASALFLRAGDRLAVRNTGGDRHSLMQPEKSFIGLVKLADAEDPEEEF